MLAGKNAPIVQAEEAVTSPRVRVAILQLADAHEYSLTMQADLWEYAVEIDSLLVDGLTTSDLRWMVHNGYAEHACETTRARDAARKFCSRSNLGFTKRTCFVLTEAGAQLAAGWRSGPTLNVSERPSLTICAASAAPQGGRTVPSWDAVRRVLQVDGVVVKKFKVPSASQECILTAFEEEGWPAAIEDPLPACAEQDPRRRLRNTIQSLNANQKVRLLHFAGDGRGDHILWDLADRSAAFVPAVVERGLRRAA